MNPIISFTLSPSFSPFKSELTNIEYQKWLIHKPELIFFWEYSDFCPLAYLCDQILLQTYDPDLVSLVKLLQQTIEWQPCGKQYISTLNLHGLAWELDQWLNTKNEKDHDPEDATSLESLIKSGSAFYSTQYLYPNDPSKIYDILEIIEDIPAAYLQKMTADQVGPIYLVSSIINRIRDLQIVMVIKNYL